MEAKPSFATEVWNLLIGISGNPVSTCMQCGTCSATCPVVSFMDYSPRKIIAMIRAELREQVLCANTFWLCSSCYHCAVRCPRGINITEFMYALKRYTIRKKHPLRSLLGPRFTKRFVNIIRDQGRLYEPGLLPLFIFRQGFRGFLDELTTGIRLLIKGRLPIIPHRMKRRKEFQNLLCRIAPPGGKI